MSCELCIHPGGNLIWQDEFCRVVQVDDAHYPGFCRVILNQHLKDMSDLSDSERLRMMRVVFAVEAAVRSVVLPDKINLASLGNMTPHLHWHVIPRFIDDRHFPNPIWGAVRHERGALRTVDGAALRIAVVEQISAL
jgi:diadenosine tetraphosphate (Ap4A) HIT family hydrolase